MNATCPECGKPVGPNALQGLCPECLMKIGLGTEAPSGASAGAGTHAQGKAFVPPTPAELAPMFPQLEVRGLIGQGGMGAVYKARQKELDRVVALKILPPGIGQDPSFAERFTREAKALAKLNHPGIVTIYDFGWADGSYFFLMEHVDGVNLRQLLQGSRISAREALAIVPQICDALQYAHDHGIVHRDIKPENILLDRQGRVKVADFGLAKIVKGGDVSPRRPGEGEQTTGSAVPTALTAAGKIMGTPQYMAPEQREYPTEVDHRADIYSLGVVFYQMLTGELPAKPIEPPSRKVRVDVRLDEVVLRALEQKPELRYQCASVLKTQIETIATTPLEKLKPLDEPPSAPPVQKSGRFGKRALLLSGLGLGLAALLIWLFFPMPVRTSPPHAPLDTSRAGAAPPVEGRATVTPTNEATLRQIQAARVELPYAEAELERLTRAYSNNAIPVQQLNQAKYKVEELQAESKGGEAEVLRIRLQQAEEDLARAKDALDHFAIPQEQYEQAKLKVDLLRAQLTPIPGPSPSTNQERDHR